MPGPCGTFHTSHWGNVPPEAPAPQACVCRTGRLRHGRSACLRLQTAPLRQRGPGASGQAESPGGARQALQSCPGAGGGPGDSGMLFNHQETGPVLTLPLRVPRAWNEGGRSAASHGRAPGSQGVGGAGACSPLLCEHCSDDAGLPPLPAAPEPDPGALTSFIPPPILCPSICPSCRCKSGHRGARWSG